MSNLYKLTISIWLFACITSVVVSTPMSHVLKIQDDHSVREKREVSESSIASKQIDTKPNIQSFTVTSNVKYRYATTVVSSRVSNPADVAKEISFTVTLPDAAFISGFLMQIKEKIYEAYVKEKEEAKRDYNEAVERGETAGHVEMSSRDSNVFTVSVNVEPQSKVTFNLTYEQLLSRSLGLYENIINVNPGQIVKSMLIEINIQESSNITVLQVPDLKTNNEIDSVYTQNKLAAIEQSGKTGKITWNPTIEQQQALSSSGIKGQFIVRYDVDRISNPNQILLDEGYFVHFYAPSDLKPLNKHVVFALDVSGSMSGKKIKQLRESLVKILGDIEEGDYFSIILFSNNVQLWTLNGTVGTLTRSGGWYSRNSLASEIEISDQFIIPATSENIAKARIFADTLTETGSTNIIAALRTSTQIAQWGQKEFAKKAKPLIIFLTDGQPNIEMSNTEEIVKTIKNLNVDKYPLFSLALGDDADYNFLRKLSISNSGFARKIYVASDTSLQLNNFYKEVASPLLSNVSFEYVAGQIADNTLTKSIFNNLFNGSELVVAGRLADKTKTINGHLVAQSSNGFFRTDMLPPTIMDHSHSTNKAIGHLEKLWAYLYIKQLLDKDLLSDEKNSEYKQNALKLSLKYSFVTPLTSLVVRKPNETSNADVHKAQDFKNGHQFHHLSAMPVSDIYSGAKIAGGVPVSAPAPPMYHPAFKNRYDALLPGEDALVFPLGAGHPVVHTSTINPKRYQHNSLIIGLGGSETTAIPIRTTSASIRSGNNNSSGLLNITDITWLKNKTDIKFPATDNTYSIGQNDLPNIEYKICTLPNSNRTLAHCRHLVHCVIPEIVSNFNDFLPYGQECVIDGRFIGICCPDKYHSKP